MVPLIALAAGVSSAATKLTWPSATVTLTSGDAARDSVPSGPLTTISPSPTFASTPLARATGTFATRDIGVLPLARQAT